MEDIESENSAVVTIAGAPQINGHGNLVTIQQWENEIDSLNTLSQNEKLNNVVSDGVDFMNGKEMDGNGATDDVLIQLGMNGFQQATDQSNANDGLKALVDEIQDECVSEENLELEDSNAAAKTNGYVSSSDQYTIQEENGTLETSIADVDHEKSAESPPDVQNGDDMIPPAEEGEIHETVNNIQQQSTDNVTPVHSETTEFTKNQNGRYDCVNCGKEFSLLASLKKHIVVVHSNGELLKCPKCIKLCLNPEELAAHLLQHSMGALHECTKCQQAFRSPAALSRHVCMSHEERPKLQHQVNPLNECSWCEEAFVSAAALSRHVAECHVDQPVLQSTGNPFKCTSCELTFCSQDEVSRHVAKFHDERADQNVFSKKIAILRQTLQYKKKFKCEECGAQFSEDAELTAHRTTHARPDQPLHCIFCGLTFPDQSMHTLHMLLHNNERKHKCTTCGKLFMTEAYLLKHLPIHFDGIHRCKHCTFASTSAAELKTHEKTHNSDKHQCYKCKSKFFKDSDLVRHMFFHFGGKFECEICEKRIRVPAEKINNVKKSNACPVCDKLFLNAAFLAQHINNHSGGKFKCNDCIPPGAEEPVVGEKSGEIKTKGKLKKKKRHEHKQSWRCEICPRVFFCQDDFEYHVAIHEKSIDDDAKSPASSGPDEHSCRACYAQFLDVSDLREHLKTHMNGGKSSPDTSPSGDFLCSECNAQFLNQSDLDEHVSSHKSESELKMNSSVAGSDEYSCSTCHAQFLLATDLNEHMVSHERDETDPEPIQNGGDDNKSDPDDFVCAECKAQFLQKADLEEHMASHNDSKKDEKVDKGSDNLLYESEVANEGKTASNEHITGGAEKANDEEDSTEPRKKSESLLQPVAVLNEVSTVEESTNKSPKSPQTVEGMSLAECSQENDEETSKSEKNQPSKDDDTIITADSTGKSVKESTKLSPPQSEGAQSSEGSEEDNEKAEVRERAKRAQPEDRFLKKAETDSDSTDDAESENDDDETQSASKSSKRISRAGRSKGATPQSKDVAGKRQQCRICKKDYYDSYTLRRHLINVHGRGKGATPQSKERERAKRVQPEDRFLKEAETDSDSTDDAESENDEDKTQSASKSSKTKSRAVRGKGATPQSKDVAGKRQQCRICKKYYCDSSTLQRHLINVHDEFPYECARCDKGFLRRCELNQHEKLPSCKDQENLEQSVSLANESREAEGKRKKRPSSRLIENWEMDESDRVPFSNANFEKAHNCKVCGAVFFDRAQLYKHLLQHAGVEIDDTKDDDGKLRVGRVRKSRVSSDESDEEIEVESPKISLNASRSKTSNGVETVKRQRRPSRKLLENGDNIDENSDVELKVRKEVPVAEESAIKTEIESPRPPSNEPRLKTTDNSETLKEQSRPSRKSRGNRNGTAESNDGVQLKVGRVRKRQVSSDDSNVEKEEDSPKAKPSKTPDSGETFKRQRRASRKLRENYDDNIEENDNAQLNIGSERKRKVSNVETGEIIKRLRRPSRKLLENDDRNEGDDESDDDTHLKVRSVRKSNAIKTNVQAEDSPKNSSSRSKRKVSNIETDNTGEIIKRQRRPSRKLLENDDRNDGDDESDDDDTHLKVRSVRKSNAITTSVQAEDSSSSRSKTRSSETNKRPRRQASKLRENVRREESRTKKIETEDDPEIVDKIAKSTSNVKDRWRQCYLCPNFYFDKSTLNKHLKGHHGVNEIDNSKVKRYRSSKVKHNIKLRMLGNSKAKREIETGGLKKTRCVQCHKRFPNASSLKKHLFDAHGHTQLKCPHCKKTFLMPAYLKKHIMAVHENVNDFTNSQETICRFNCQNCDSVFDNKTELSLHLNIEGCMYVGSEDDTLPADSEMDIDENSDIEGAKLKDEVASDQERNQPGRRKRKMTSSDVRGNISVSSDKIENKTDDTLRNRSRRSRRFVKSEDKMEVESEPNLNDDLDVNIGDEKVNERSSLPHQSSIKNDSEDSSGELSDPLSDKDKKKRKSRSRQKSKASEDPNKSKNQNKRKSVPPTPKQNNRQKLRNSAALKNKINERLQGIIHKLREHIDDVKKSNGNVENRIVKSESKQQRDSRIRRPSMKMRESLADEEETTTETAEDKLRCAECRKIFSYKRTLQRHVRDVHGPGKRKPEAAEGPLTCVECHLTFSYRRTLKRHVRDIHGQGKPEAAEGPLTCVECRLTFSYRRTLKRHMLNVHRNRKTNKVTKKDGQSKSEKLVSNKKPDSKKFKCATCSKTFSEMAEFAQHLKSHNADKKRRDAERAKSLCEDGNSAETEAKRSKRISLRLSSSTGGKSSNFVEIETKRTNRTSNRLTSSTVKDGESNCDNGVNETSDDKPNAGRKNIEKEVKKVTKHSNIVKSKRISLRFSSTTDREKRSSRDSVVEETLKKKPKTVMKEVGNELTKTARTCDVKKIREMKGKCSKCSVCKKVFFDKSTLNRHVKFVHMNIKALQCPDCPYTCSRNDYLMKHAQTHEPKSKRKKAIVLQRGKKMAKIQNGRSKCAQCGKSMTNLKMQGGKLKCAKCSRLNFKSRIMRRGN